MNAEDELEREQDAKKNAWLLAVKQGEVARAVLDKFWPGWKEEQAK